MKTTESNLLSLLEICRDIEMCCADIYRLYAERFSEDKQMRELWEKTYEEEQNHARQFELAINMGGDNPITGMNMDKVKALRILNMLKDTHAGILVNMPSKTDALQSAICFEKMLAEFHATSSGSFTNQSMENLFRAMMLNDTEHLESLQKAYQSIIQK